VGRVGISRDIGFDTNNATTVDDNTAWIPSSASEICRRMNIPQRPTIKSPRKTAAKLRGVDVRPVREWFALQSSSTEAWSIVLSQVHPFLSREECDRLQLVFPSFDPLYGPTRLFPPVPPLWRRFSGCGRDSALVESKHSSPSSFVLFHYAWDFLTTPERKTLGEVSSVWKEYAKLRQAAMQSSVGFL
jgi:hypothetical protein